MKRFSLVSFIILLSILVVGCSSKMDIKDIFDAYEVETTENVPFVSYDKLIFNNTTLDFGEILEENKCDGTFHEVYVIYDDTIWFGYADAKKNETDSTIWNIAAISVNGEEFNIRYSGEFCFDVGADKVYMRNNNNCLKEDYKTDNGFYYDGKIVLTDNVKTIEYNLQTNNTTEFIATSYEYPSLIIKPKIVVHHTILFSKESEQKVFDVKQAKQTSNVFNKLYELEKEKNWQGESYTSKLFDKVQIVNNQIYIICRVLNWDGETHAIVFQYDYDTNSCKYAFHCFMGDIIGNDLYVVPII